jgi:gas vesicle protein
MFKITAKGGCMSNTNYNNSGAILISFLLGSLCGASLALLLAPQPGKKTRRQITDIAEDAKDYAYDSAKKLKKKIT